jgi:hypothetical protein
MNRLKNKLSMLNVFDSESNDIETTHRERIASRLYLFIFSISIYIITIYIVYLNITVNTSISNPSEDKYNELSISYSDTLDCPCKKISIEYKYFVEIHTRFHSICPSDFTSRKWLDYLSFGISLHYYDRRDIRVRGNAYFSFLSALCQISETTINNAIDQFLHDTFISTRLIPESEFQIQIDNIISQFQNVTLAKFSRSLKLIRGVMDGNAFVSSYSLNWEWWDDLNRIFYALPTRPIIMNDGCSCGTRSDCMDPGGVYDKLRNGLQIFPMPGWNIGCSVVDTVLHSTFECLYNQSCINSLLFHFNGSSRINISAINSSIESRFKRNTRIQNIANQLFVEEWKINSNYSSFYNQCSPISCSYKNERDDYLIYTVSKILGLYGGLTVTLQFTTPLIIKIIFQIRNRCRRNRVTPIG